MFWILKKNIFSDKAAAFFNALNNGNNSSAGNSKSKNVGYNKLSSQEDLVLDEWDEKNGNFIPPGDPKNSIGKLDLLADMNQASDYEEELTDDSDYDESLTCNVCDRSFYNRKMLERHQQKKRHFGCSACDTLFPSLMQMEHHKEEFDHWSDSETSALTCQHHCHHDVDDFEDDDSYIESGEEMERLL